MAIDMTYGMTARELVHMSSEYSACRRPTRGPWFKDMHMDSQIFQNTLGPSKDGHLEKEWTLEHGRASRTIDWIHSFNLKETGTRCCMGSKA